ncbi:MAG: hypothetical protein FWF55_00940 [Treponema sp.]|jgi:hypothetical protein|nr:hypothetical protein [Treponema sp.]
MLVVEGFFENGVFVPDIPLVDVKGRQNATLTITENEEKERQERITAWRQFGEAVLNSDEVLEGEPERFRFRPFEEI